MEMVLSIEVFIASYDGYDKELSIDVAFLVGLGEHLLVPEGPRLVRPGDLTFVWNHRKFALVFGRVEFGT
jgi:hypothetical protein